MSSSSSSSSSSSYLDYSGEGMLEFTYGDENIRPVWKLAYGSDYIYAGTGDGKILRSSNGFFWETFYQVDDINITAIHIFNKKLYSGTSPHGKVYVTDLITNETELSQTLSGSISNFFDFKNEIYVTTDDPSGIYKYNEITKIWNLTYKPYGTRINKILKIGNGFTIFMNVNQIIVSDGTNFKLVV